VRGRWGPAFSLPNVGIHRSVLPTGKVLMWGRRDRPDDSLDVHECTPFVWNPADGAAVSTPQPKRADGTKVNLFCSGHCFLPDGRLLVVGGHQADSDGLSQACLYDAAANTWTPTAPMTTPAGEEVRRWYPTATTLADGTVLVLSGSFIDPSRPAGMQVIVADLLQIWAEGTWRTISKDDGTPLNFIGLPLYPRMHVAADGQVFMSGTNDRTLLVKTSTPGQWTKVAFRVMGNRDYCPAVMYDVGKVIYIGGGNNTDTHAPIAETEIIDLGANQPTWQKTSAMAFPRRQHNAVLLPDGTVLVLGGTRGGGGPNNGFNDLAPGQPVHIAELWNPDTGQWTSLAAESVDRCYHATAVLLPDARVLSAGGGEYRPDGVVTNDPEDSHPHTCSASLAP
jgi:galactose oxidase